MKLQWRSERFVAFIASWLSTCFLFQAAEELADDHLGVDLRTAGLLAIAAAAVAIAWSCARTFRRGRSLKAVRWALREDLRAMPALRSPSTLFRLTFAAILTVALASHAGAYPAATIPDHIDIVVAVITAVTLATGATVGAHIIIRLVPEVVQFVAALLTRLRDSSALVIALDAETTALRSFPAWSTPLFSRPPPLPLYPRRIVAGRPSAVFGAPRQNRAFHRRRVASQSCHVRSPSRAILRPILRV
jgi:hypothetical protein